MDADSMRDELAEMSENMTEEERVAIIEMYLTMLDKAHVIGTLYLNMLLDGKGDEANELVCGVLERLVNYDRGAIEFLKDEIGTIVSIMEAMNDSLGHKIED